MRAWRQTTHPHHPTCLSCAYGWSVLCSYCQISDETHRRATQEVNPVSHISSVLLTPSDGNASSFRLADRIAKPSFSFPQSKFTFNCSGSCGAPRMSENFSNPSESSNPQISPLATRKLRSMPDLPAIPTPFCQPGAPDLSCRE